MTQERLMTEEEMMIIQHRKMEEYKDFRKKAIENYNKEENDGNMFNLTEKYVEADNKMLKLVVDWQYRYPMEIKRCKEVEKLIKQKNKIEEQLKHLETIKLDEYYVVDEQNEEVD